MSIIYDQIDSPLGAIRIACHDNALTGLWFVGQKYEIKPAAEWTRQRNDQFLKRVSDELMQYFSGKRHSFDLPLRLAGTSFQESVWKELLRIPSGQTISYGELAKRLGKPSAVRAVAAAVGRNPASVVVPCHRVVGANGSLTGYAGGLGRKKHLLALESSRHGVYLKEH